MNRFEDELRILIVTPDYPPPPGGIQTITRNIERGLNDAGHTVELLHIDPGDYNPTLRDILPRWRWCYSTRAAVTGQFVYQQTVYTRVKDRISSFEPDIVHAMHIRNWSALVAANEVGLPTVLSTYALELEETELAAVAINAAEIVHAISEFTASLVDDAVEGSVETRLIHPSIDVSAYQTAHEQVTQDTNKTPVLTMARFVERKNIETVIQAWKQMDEAAIADRDLIVAGDGPKREAFERLAADRDDVRFVGWVNGEEKRELLAESVAFVMVPRRDEFDVEGFGIVYIEAQAAGTPVVGSKHGGAPEAIGDAGIIVDDENDPTNVGPAIETLLDTDQRTKYEQKAAERIGQFDIPVITEKFLSLYDSLKSRSA